MMRGGTPAVAPPRMRAIGVRPCFFAAASEAMISAAAPSLTPEALPAVTVPPSAKSGLQLRRAPPCVVPARGCSSLSTTSGSPLRCGIGDGRDLLAEAAVLPARRRRACLAAHGEGVLVRAADAEVRGDVLAGLAAWNRRRSSFFISGLTKRQPMVVS